MHRVLYAAACSGLIALDFTGWGPWMVSQPMVCGPILATLMGQPVVGLIIGGIAQLLWLDMTAIGVGIPYDATAVTLLGVYWGTLPPHSALSQIILAFFMAVPFGFIFRWVDIGARRLNSVVVHRLDHVSDARLPAALPLVIFGALLWTLARFTLTYIVAMYAGQTFWNRMAYIPKLTRFDQALTIAVILLPVAGMGVALELLLSEEPESRFNRFRRFKPKEGVGDS